VPGHGSGAQQRELGAQRHRQLPATEP